MSTSSRAAGARAYAAEHRDGYRSELLDLLRIKSISTLPEHRQDIRRAAEYVADALTRAGLDTAEVIQTAGHPLVYGEWLHIRCDSLETVAQGSLSMNCSQQPIQITLPGGVLSGLLRARDAGV